MRLLVESNSFQAFVSERGRPFRPADLFDELVGAGADEAASIAALAHQLALNEAPNANNQAFTPRMPTPSEASLAGAPGPFPLLDPALVGPLSYSEGGLGWGGGLVDRWSRGSGRRRRGVRRGWRSPHPASSRPPRRVSVSAPAPGSPSPGDSRSASTLFRV